MESDCEAVPHITGKQTSSVGLLLIARIQQVRGTEPMDMIRLDRPRSNYHTNRLEVELFPDP